MSLGGDIYNKLPFQVIASGSIGGGPRFAEAT